MGITDIQFPLSLFSENRDKAILANREFMDEEEQKYGIYPTEIYGKSKSRKASAARKALILLCMEHTRITKMITRG